MSKLFNNIEDIINVDINFDEYIKRDIINSKINNNVQLSSEEKIFLWTRTDEFSPKSKDKLLSLIADHIKKDVTNLNFIDVSHIKDMSCLINYRIGQLLKDIDISEWDVSNVTNMACMFYGCENFNSDLSKWNVFNVKDMSMMFYGCENFNSDLSKWDVSNVEDMHGMFWDCQNFNCELNDWNISSKTNTEYMLFGTKKSDYIHVVLP